MQAACSGKGTLKEEYKHELRNQLWHTDGFHIIQIGDWLGHAYFQFVPKDTSLTFQEFLNQNEDIAQHFEYLDSTKSFDSAVIYFDTAIPAKYSEYIHQVLMLFRLLISVEKSEATQYIIENLGFTQARVANLLTSYELLAKYRRSFI